MPLRLIELTLPADSLGALDDWPGDRPIIDLWRLDGQERCTVKLLVDSRHAEDLVDGLFEAVGDVEGCRMVSLPVEATVPRPKEDDEAEGDRDQDRPDGESKPLGRVSREELYNDLRAGSEPDALFVIQVVLSTIIACVGLLQNDTAVVVGAMVIAPLLGPNVALGFGATLGDLTFVRRALVSNGLGLGLAGGLSMLIGLLFAVDAEIAAISTRTQAGLDDVVLALATGVAGTLAVTSGIATVLIGVMVAVALLPPLAAAGLLAGSGLWFQASSAGLLVVINVVCLNLASVATFVALGIRPRGWWEQEGARRSSRAALLVWTVALTVLLIALLLRAAL